MKIYITDIRNNPRIVYIDGKRFILPSKKEIIKDVSKGSYEALSKLPFMKVRPVEEEPVVEEPKAEDLIAEEPVSSGDMEEVKEEPKVVVEAPKEEAVPEMVNASEVLTESVIVSQEEVAEEPKAEIPAEEPAKEEDKAVDYSSMSKKELRAVLGEKGVDTTGMTKAVMLEKLKEIG